MKSLTFVLALTAFLVLEASHHRFAGAQNPPASVNKICPIGKEPIDGATFIEIDGRTVGFCCPGCDDAYRLWSDQRRAAFVKRALDGAEPVTPSPPSEPSKSPRKAPKSDPYLLDVCPVSGEKLGSMGEPIAKTVNGRRFRLCCAGCISSREKDIDSISAKVAPEIARRQMPYYPLQTCVVTGEPLEVDGQSDAIDHVHNNRLVRLCCASCVRKFASDPAPYLEKLDKAVLDAQNERYPLENCAVVETSPLGGMGKPAEIVVANRLVRFCCAGCLPSFEEDPPKFIRPLDAAWNPIHAKTASGAGKR